MIRLNSFLHRLTLSDIIGRWMMDQLKPADVRILKELVNYNCHIAPLVLDDVATTILGELARGPVESVAVHTKGHLKDYLVGHPWHRNDRVDEIIGRYQRVPQEFYRETPFDGRIYLQRSDGKERYVGSTRRKRMKRISEKSARRIIDYVFGRIKNEAQTLANERATQLGVPVDRLVTPSGQQEEEFIQAEQRIMDQIRTGQIRGQMPPLDINDVLGIKAVCDDDDVKRLLSILESHPRLHIIELEQHSGVYNALNVTLRLQVDKDALRRNAPTGAALDKFRSRGLADSDVAHDYRRFINEGEDHLLLELIVSSYQETLESEIGRAIHEERVMKQRAAQQYRGSLARNIAALMEFMMALRRFPRDDIKDIPIKLWIKYMPDYFESVMKATYGIGESEYLGGSLPPPL